MIQRDPCIPAPPEQVFEEPWQAQAFSMAVALHQAGHFTWGEWAETLGRHIASGERSYYEHWLAALEEIATAKGLADSDGLSYRREAWRQAAEATPHGQPIVLSGHD